MANIVCIYEDNHILALDKPGGILTQPSGTDQVNLQTLAKAWLKEKYQKPGNVFLETIHRLDKPVSGIVLFAKTSKALSRLQASMRERLTLKRYFALVEGTFDGNDSNNSEEYDLQHYLTHDDFYAKIVANCDFNTKEQDVLKSWPDAKKAKLSYRILQENPKTNQTLLDVRLETGRYHQIRAQFSHIGHPIVGDVKYGSKIAWKEKDGIALMHYYLEIPHPISGEDLQLKILLKDEFKEHLS